MRFSENAISIGRGLVAATLTMLLAGCETWTTYHGPVVKGSDAVLKVSRTDVLYVTTVDGVQYAKDSEGEFQGPVRLLPGFHQVRFVLHGGTPSPWGVGMTLDGEAVTRTVFVEPGKTYIPRVEFNGGRWRVAISEEK